MEHLRAFLAMATLVALLAPVTFGNVAFEVHSKFKGTVRSLSSLKEHDSRRHGRLLSSINVPLGGDGDPSDTGLYYGKIGLGNPSKDFYVQVDTGSDILWVNCAGCDKCPTKSDLGIDLEPYSLNSSSTGTAVTCDQQFCVDTYAGPIQGCKSDMRCQYNVVYGDGSSTNGYYVKDEVHLNQVTGNPGSSLINASVVFGCADKQSGDFGSSSSALSGLMGFGQSDTSVLSQLSKAGKVKKIFSHCLDNKRGGGIFTIGEVVEPKVKTTALVPNQSHYNIVMKAMYVGTEEIQISSGILDFLEGDKQAIVDSGTTLAYLPSDIYDSLMTKIVSKQPDLKLESVDTQFTCFQFPSDVDSAFPPVTFEFAGSLNLTVKPHEYLFQIGDAKWCFGWMSSTMQSKGKDVTLLGDLVISNKLVVYDLVNQTVGWVDYNCSSTVKLKDEKSGGTYNVDAQNLNSAAVTTVSWLLMIPAVLYSLAS